MNSQSIIKVTQAFSFIKSISSFRARKFIKILLSSLKLESSISQNIRNFFRVRYYSFYSSTSEIFLEVSVSQSIRETFFGKIFFWKNFLTLVQKSSLLKYFNLGDRKFHFTKYNENLFWKNIRKFFREVFFIIFWVSAWKCTKFPPYITTIDYFTTITLIDSNISNNEFVLRMR